MRSTASLFRVVIKMEPEFDMLPRPWSGKKIIGVLIVLITVIGTAGWWVFGSIRPELVGSVIPGTDAYSLGDRLYWVDRRAGEFLVWSLDPDANSGELVFRGTFSGDTSGPHRFVGEYLYVMETPRRAPVQSGGVSFGAPAGSAGSAGASRRPQRFLGDFMAAVTRRPGETASERPEISDPVPGPGILHMISLKDGRIRRVSAQTDRIPGLSIQGDRLYWIRHGPAQAVTVRKGTEYWSEYPPDCALMASPLDGGRPTTIAAGLTRSSVLSIGPEFILWSVPRRAPDARRDLRYMRLRDGKRGSFVQKYAHEPPVEYMGRLYWIERTASYYGPSEPARIVEGDPVSDENRVVHENAGAELQLGEVLPAHNGRLYGIAVKRARMSTAPSPGYFGVGAASETRLLARLDPQGENFIAALREIPGRYTSPLYLAGDYVYYGRLEPRESLFDFAFTASTARMEHALYRLPLP